MAADGNTSERPTRSVDGGVARENGFGDRGRTAADSIFSSLLGSLRFVQGNFVQLGVVPSSLRSPLSGFDFSLQSWSSSPPVVGVDDVKMGVGDCPLGGGVGFSSLVPSVESMAFRIPSLRLRDIADQVEAVAYYYIGAVAVGAALGAAVTVGLGLGCAAAYGLTSAAGSIPGVWKGAAATARSVAAFWGRSWGLADPPSRVVNDEGEGGNGANSVNSVDRSDVYHAGDESSFEGSRSAPLSPRRRGQSTGKPPPDVHRCGRGRDEDISFLGSGSGRIAVARGEMRPGWVGADMGGPGQQCRDCLDHLSAVLGEHLLVWADVRRLTAFLVIGRCDGPTFRSVLAEYPLGGGEGNAVVTSVVYVQALERESTFVQLEALASAPS